MKIKNTLFISLFQLLYDDRHYHTVPIYTAYNIRASTQSGVRTNNNVRLKANTIKL